jgi:hypothetical protein
MARRALVLIVCGFLLALPLAVWAESSSTTYIMWGHAFTGGGALGTSSSYIGYSTLGDLGGADSSSANYNMDAGFQQLVETPVIIFSFSSNTAALTPDPLTTGSVSSASVTLTVGTNADFGYTLTATETSAFQNQSASALADVTDGSVTAGTEEFGIAVSGTDASFGDDEALTASPLAIATNTIYGNNRDTVVTFKAAIDSGSAAGAYTGTVTFIATGNY